MNNQNTIRKISQKTNLLTASVAEIVRETARRFARRALKETPPLIGAATRAQHTQFLKSRIIGMRLPRGKLTRRMMRTMHMSKKEARAYFRVAKARQGEMIGGWTRGANAVGIPVPSWINRHGGKHGRVSMQISGRGALPGDRAGLHRALFREAFVEFEFTDSWENSRRTNMRNIAHNIKMAVFRGMRGEIERGLRRAVRG